MTDESLLDSYYEFAMDGNTLMPFIEEVLQGHDGPPDREPILRFLDRVQWIILGNIDTRFDEGPGLEADPASVREETEDEVNAARMRVLQYFSS